MFMGSLVMIANIYGFAFDYSQYLWIHLCLFQIFMDSPVLFPNIYGFTCVYPIFIDLPVIIPIVYGFICEDSKYL